MADIFVSATKILKNDYMPRMANSVYMKHPILSLIKKDGKTYNMNQKSFNIKARTYGAPAYPYPHGTPGTELFSGRQAYEELTVAIKTIQSSALLTDINTKLKEPGIAVDLAIDTKNQIQAAISQALNKALVTETAGELCKLNGDHSTATTITCDAPGTLNLVPGQFIVIGSTNARVNTINSLTEFTIVDDDATSHAGVSESDNVSVYIRRYSGNTISGLGTLLVKTGTVQGVNLATNFALQPWIDDDAETINTADIIKLALQANRHGNGVNILATSEDMWRKIGADLTSLKQLNLTKADSFIDLPGGFSGIKFAAGQRSIPLIADPDIPYHGGTTIFGLTTEGVGLGVLNQDFLPGAQGVFNKLDKLPEWEATYMFYGNAYVSQPKAQFVLKNKRT